VEVKPFVQALSVTLNSTINAGNIWYKDSVMIPSANGASITVSEPGIYYVSSQRPGYCINIADTIKINVTKAIKPILNNYGRKQYMRRRQCCFDIVNKWQPIGTKMD